MSLNIALVGNPNSGKTSLFNEVTGSTQYVGNWSGVTVEKKEGRAKNFSEDIKIIDLPGIYSLSPYSMEEIIARDYIIEEKPDVVINIVDATNIERNLYLTTQLIELKIPMVIALNMIDVVNARGDVIDIETLEKELGISIVATSASKSLGIDDLITKAIEVSNKKVYESSMFFYDNQIEESICEIEKAVIPFYSDEKYNSRWLSLKLLEDDAKITEKFESNDKLLMLASSHRKTIEKVYKDDIESVIADNRYRYISKLVQNSITKKMNDNDLSPSDKIDKIVTNRFMAIPIFFGIMYLIFRITFGFVGSTTITMIDEFINVTFVNFILGLFSILGVTPFLQSLIIDGIIAGVGSVLVFVPQIMILFFFLSILEDSGYMARTAFIMDKLLRKLGLSGKSFIPMLLGFGCSVPAIMATRTLENEKDRRMTIILAPFMSCGARLPIYALFAAAFFSDNQSFVIFSMYFIGIIVAILSGILLKNTILKGEASSFIMEMPPYRIPTIKSLIIHMWDKGKDFIKKAGTIIFAASVIIWFTKSFSFSFVMVEDTKLSILGILGGFIAPIFEPLGFGDWKSAVALITGLAAKELVVATMGILHGVSDTTSNALDVKIALQNAFTPLSAYSFMVFTLLYMPCVAAFATIKKEMNSWNWTLFAVVYQTSIAWFVAFMIYQIGKIF